jgi:hypothetical protein
MKFNMPENTKNKRFRLFPVIAWIALLNAPCLAGNDTLKINDREYFEKLGFNVLVFSNWYNDNFSDSKISGIEIIHHGIRTATNGDVRLSSTPGQWDPIPELVNRNVNREDHFIPSIGSRLAAFHVKTHTLCSNFKDFISLSSPDLIKSCLAGYRFQDNI